ncbi:hypothetical protein ACOTDF_30225, partial [Achromobacter insuavis]|uniref:hypothetical protein n=1 Tax=Achromobacter insuavis TaxID=1287735 RepID=UPI003B9C3D59
SRACPRRKTARSLSCCRIGGNLLHKQNRQGCVQQALTMSKRLCSMGSQRMLSEYLFRYGTARQTPK